MKYQYRIIHNGKIIEMEQSIHDDAYHTIRVYNKEIDPDSGEEVIFHEDVEVERIITAPPFHLAGTCWSRDNYAGKQ